MTKEQMEKLFNMRQTAKKSAEEQIVFLTLLIKVFLNEGPPLKVSRGIYYMVSELSEFVVFV